jgi:hypothetical protein
MEFFSAIISAIKSIWSVLYGKYTVWQKFMIIGAIITSSTTVYFFYNRNEELKAANYYLIAGNYQGLMTKEFIRLKIDSLKEIKEYHYYTFKTHEVEPYHFNSEGTFHPNSAWRLWENHYATIYLKAITDSIGYVYIKNIDGRTEIDIRFTDKDSSYLHKTY